MAKPNPTDRRYTVDHEWALNHGDGTITLGITDHAQELLTDIVFVELPEAGKRLEKGSPLAVVESVKSVSDVYAPLAGEVTAVNRELEDHPERINQDAFGDGWICRMKMDDPADWQGLLEAQAYTELIAGKAS